MKYKKLCPLCLRSFKSMDKKQKYCHYQTCSSARKFAECKECDRPLRHLHSGPQKRGFCSSKCEKFVAKEGDE